MVARLKKDPSPYMVVGKVSDIIDRIEAFAMLVVRSLY